MDQINRAIRIERLKQVREQERRISQQRRKSYSGSIVEEKEHRENSSRVSNRKNVMALRNKLSQTFKTALLHTGDGHHVAVDSVHQLVGRIKMEEERALLQNRAAASRGPLAAQKLAKFREINIHSKQKERLRVLRTKISYSREERGDARAEYESQIAKLEAQARAAAYQREILATKPQLAEQGKIDNYSTSIYQRGPTVVHAKVIRHNTKAGDVRDIQRHVAEEASSAARKLFKAVLRQLTSDSKAVKRAKEARLVSETKRLTRTFEDDLTVLQNLDRQGIRATRVKNVDTIPQVDSDLKINNNFEDMFFRHARARYQQRRGGCTNVVGGAPSQNKVEIAIGTDQVPVRGYFALNFACIEFHFQTLVTHTGDQSRCRVE